MKRIILCADDYAQDSAVCEGILRLSRLKKINAISCLVNFPLWADAHQALKPLQTDGYLGLHLNLTDGDALSSSWQQTHGTSFQGLPSLLKLGYRRQIDKKALAAEIRAQLDTYHHAMGAFPDFIDGHQHVHQLPFLRETLISIYTEYKLTSFVRTTSNGWQDLLYFPGFPKQQMIAALGGMAFNQRLKKEAIATNTSFAGVYSFSKAARYQHYFRQFLTTIRDGGMIMCHPGSSTHNPHDPLHYSRPHELNYFLSEQFMMDLKKADVQLARKIPLEHAFNP